MTRIHHVGRAILLTALAIGINVLSYANVAHGRKAAHHSRVNYSHVPPHGSHRPTSRSGRAQRLAASDNHSAEQVEAKLAKKLKPIDPPVLAPAVALLTSPVMIQPEMVSEPLAQVNILAFGSAPRAPGGSRAPPIA